ncbi:unnamed protein product [Coregonus sp. 'balchen']|nr:unnamed protein product [Coregonus sp. 'balchen']
MRVSHVIPLSCICPIDFEFQVYIIQPHKAFSVQPLSGVIPANGKVEVTVTFRPFQYDTSQVTLQVVISQFNSKPYVCTLSGVLLAPPASQPLWGEGPSSKPREAKHGELQSLHQWKPIVAEGPISPPWEPPMGAFPSLPPSEAPLVWV